MDAFQLAEAVRAACLEAAVAAHEDAGLQGLCAEGRWEAAVGAVQSLDLRQVSGPVARMLAGSPSGHVQPKSLMNAPNLRPSRSGRAFRVSLLGQQQAEAYRDVHVVLDGECGVVHVLSADGQTHYLTIPVASALIEWKDPTALEPQLRVSPLGPGAFQQFGEQIQRMVEGLGGGPGTG